LPCSQQTQMLGAWKGKKDISVVDVALFVQGKEGAPADAKTVALDHFEYDMDSDASNQKKLELLEQLVHDKKKVLIVTLIDPLFYLESAANGSVDTSAAGRERSRTLQRWGKVLDSFTTKRLQCTSLTYSKACYRILWSTFTRNEQAAFYSLAQDGWANYKNRAALEHLLLRGLIQRTPMFQIAPEFGHFGEFIGGAVTREERSRWDTLHVPGYFEWDGLRVMFVILLSGTVAAVLFFNQFVVLGYITSVISAFLPVAKLLTDMRGSRGAQATKTDGASA
jgi:hypothetical protein